MKRTMKSTKKTSELVCMGIRQFSISKHLSDTIFTLCTFMLGYFCSVIIVIVNFLKLHTHSKVCYLLLASIINQETR